MPQFTVLTPTFKRAHRLRRVFASLSAQRDFEWSLTSLRAATYPARTAQTNVKAAAR